MTDPLTEVVPDMLTAGILETETEVTGFKIEAEMLGENAEIATAGREEIFDVTEPLTGKVIVVPVIATLLPPPPPAITLTFKPDTEVSKAC